MQTIFVPDGYTLTGAWPAAPDGRYPGGRFTYRLALAEARDRYRTAMAHQVAAVRAEILAKHVLSMTPDDPDADAQTGTFRPDVEQWKRIRPDIANVVLDYVLDYVAAERAEKNSASG